MSVDGHTMSAIFEGWCGSCKSAIHAGDSITQGDGNWRHTDCRELPDDPLEATHPVCQKCWLTHPEGACDR